MDETKNICLNKVTETKMEDELRIIISGGGTGGHIFPAISIANSIKAKRPDAKILLWVHWDAWRCSACLPQAMR